MPYNSKRVVIIIFAIVGITGAILLDAFLVGSTMVDSKVMAGFADFNRYGAFIPLGIAVLVGHWYTPIRNGVPLVRSPWNYVLLGSAAGVMAIVHIVLFAVFYSQVESHTEFSQLLESHLGLYSQLIACISVVLGLVLGAILWPVHMWH